MPRIAKEIGPLAVKSLTSAGLHPVGGVAGLMLQVSPTGTRSWLLRVKVGEKRREIGLGAFPGVTLALARAKAQQARDEIAKGIDPVAQRAAARQTIIEQQQCRRRSNIDPPCRSNTDPGMDAGRARANCG